MRRFLLIAVLCLSSLSAYARNPPEDWKAYRMARVTANGKSSQEKVQIWSTYLAKYPESPYRDRALEELEEATGGLWAPQQSPACGPDFDLDLALGVSSEPAPSPALTAPDRLQAPLLSSKRPAGAGLRSLGATYGGALLGGVLLAGGLESGRAGGDVLGVALWSAAVIIGPSAGHLYAGDKAHARKMSAARAIAAGVGWLGFYGATETQILCITAPCPRGVTSDAGLGLAAVGFSTASVLLFYDLIDSFFVVQRKQGRPVKNRMLRPLSSSYNAGL